MLAYAINCHEMVQTVDVSMVWAEAMTGRVGRGDKNKGYGDGHIWWVVYIFDGTI